MNNDVDYLSKILELINKIKDIDKNNEDIKKLKLKDEDTRKTFFKMLTNSLRVYYLGLDSIFLANKINPSSFNLNEFEISHAENFRWLLYKKENEDYLITYNSILKMNLINDCWVSFESTLRDINIELKLELPDSFISTIYKNTRFEAETEFLIFLGHCRNAMHNNSIHTKEYFEYELNGDLLKLEKDKKIEFLNNQIILKMIEKLSDVVLNMWVKLNDPAFIKDRYNSI